MTNLVPPKIPDGEKVDFDVSSGCLTGPRLLCGTVVGFSAVASRLALNLIAHAHGGMQIQKKESSLQAVLGSFPSIPLSIYPDHFSLLYLPIPLGIYLVHAGPCLPALPGHLASTACWLIILSWG